MASTDVSLPLVATLTYSYLQNQSLGVYEYYTGYCLLSIVPCVGFYPVYM
jgi:hypothetical protein